MTATPTPIRKAETGNHPAKPKRPTTAPSVVTFPPQAGRPRPGTPGPCTLTVGVTHRQRERQVTVSYARRAAFWTVADLRAFARALEAHLPRPIRAVSVLQSWDHCRLSFDVCGSTFATVEMERLPTATVHQLADQAVRLLVDDVSLTTGATGKAQRKGGVS